MTDAASLDYFRRREQQERALADRSHQPDARRVHLDLAERYARMTDGLPVS